MNEGFIMSPRRWCTASGAFDLGRQASYRFKARNFRNFNELQQEIEE